MMADIQIKTIINPHLLLKMSWAVWVTFLSSSNSLWIWLLICSIFWSLSILALSFWERASLLESARIWSASWGLLRMREMRRTACLRSWLVQDSCCIQQKILMLNQHTQVLASLTFSSDFDSGNMGKVTLKTPTSFSITTLPDHKITNPYSNYHGKSWIYFSLSGTTQGETYTLTLLNVSLLYSQINQTYRIVTRTLLNDWKPIASTPSIISSDQGIDYTFTFQSTGIPTFFAFTYPYTYKDYLNFISKPYNTSLYFHREVLTYSTQQRPIHLITLSSHSQLTHSREDSISPLLFPEKSTRPLQFEASKQIVLITARVHPGETPSSYVCEGILEYLMAQDCYASQLLQNYVFLMVPMLNPDGVFNGFYRKDCQNQNLNRFYKAPTFEEQPTIFAVRSLFQHYGNRIAFYFDLHAHGSKKATFCYGNALNSFSNQLLNVLYPKIMAQNEPSFDFEQCNFSKRQMTSKDKYEDLTKENCARVQINQVAAVTHSYTIECGYFEIFNSQLNLKMDNCPQLHKRIGQNLMKSIVDLYDMRNKQTEAILGELAGELSRTDRFRHLQSIKTQKKVIENLMNQLSETKLTKQKPKQSHQKKEKPKFNQTATVNFPREKAKCKSLTPVQMLKEKQNKVFVMNKQVAPQESGKLKGSVKKARSEQQCQILPQLQRFEFANLYKNQLPQLTQGKVKQKQFHSYTLYQTFLQLNQPLVHDLKSYDDKKRSVHSPSFEEFIQRYSEGKKKDSMVEKQKWNYQGLCQQRQTNTKYIYLSEMNQDFKQKKAGSNISIIGQKQTSISASCQQQLKQQLQQSKFSKQMDELDQKQKKLKKLLRQD